jgi:hypothetical protein
VPHLSQAIITYLSPIVSSICSKIKRMKTGLHNQSASELQGINTTLILSPHSSHDFGNSRELLIGHFPPRGSIESRKREDLHATFLFSEPKSIRDLQSKYHSCVFIVPQRLLSARLIRQSGSIYTDPIIQISQQKIGAKIQSDGTFFGFISY